MYDAQSAAQNLVKCAKGEKFWYLLINNIFRSFIL